MLQALKHLYSLFFGIYKEDARIVIKIFGIKIKLKNPKINQLQEICCIADLERLKNNNTIFPHPIGIVINKKAVIGRNCTIYQNVTIGDGKINLKDGRRSPIIGNNVTIYANSVVIGGIKIGDNALIGAGSVVLKDVPENMTVAGNPAKIINKNS